MKKNHAGVCASGFGRGAGSRRVRSVYMTPFSAPFSGFCPRLRSLCKGWAQDCSPPVSGAGSLRFCAPGRLTLEPGPDGKGFDAFPGKTPLRRTMPTHPSRPAPLCAAQARPARRSRHEAEGPVRRPAASPVSPEGDHFPRAPLATAYVRPSPKAPTPPLRNALRCIRGGMRGVWHGRLGAGKLRWLVSSASPSLVLTTKN